MQGSGEKVTRRTDRETLYRLFGNGPLCAGRIRRGATAGGLKKPGDPGIGTFDGPDGGMIVLEGRGRPFSRVTWFEREYAITTKKRLNSTGVTNYLTTKLPSKNTVCAIRIHGKFPFMKVRSIPEG